MSAGAGAEASAFAYSTWATGASKSFYRRTRTWSIWIRRAILKPWMSPGLCKATASGSASRRRRGLRRASGLTHRVSLTRVMSAATAWTPRRRVSETRGWGRQGRASSWRHCEVPRHGLSACRVRTHVDIPSRAAQGSRRVGTRHARVRAPRGYSSRNAVSGSICAAARAGR